MTSGNHIFDKREAVDYIANTAALATGKYPPGTPGSGLWTGEVKGVKVAVLNLMGRVFSRPQ